MSWKTWKDLNDIWFGEGNEMSFCYRHNIDIVVNHSKDCCIKVLNKRRELVCDGCPILKSTVKATSFFQ